MAHHSPDSRSVAERRRVFRRMHEHGCFVIPNPWDLGSARVLVQLGFQALGPGARGLGGVSHRRSKIAAHGTFSALRAVISGADLNARF